MVFSSAALRVLSWGLLWIVLALAGLVYDSGGVRHIVFASPWWLLGAALPLAGVLVGFRRRPPALAVARTTHLQKLPRTLAARLLAVPDSQRFAAAILLAVAAARPQSLQQSERVVHEGIDINVVLDLSDSMEAMDLQPNRLEAAKAVVDRFIASRPHDRIGLVAFGSHASTVAPLTTDHEVLRALIKRLQLGVVDGNRTAIGAGLGVALNRLKQSDGKTQIIVLLTDGAHNADGLDPASATEEAKRRGIKIFTVLMGQHSGRSREQVDPQLLKTIAQTTSGVAYTAEDDRALTESFHDLLNRLERSEINGEQIRAELFPFLLLIILVLLSSDAVLRTTYLRRFP